MKATQMLEDEHHVIQKVAASLALMAEDLNAGKRIEDKMLQAVSQFLNVFGENPRNAGCLTRVWFANF